ncbi:MAG: zf-TFIIB domain-containing protein [Pseudomonadota bacterium]
MPKRPQPEKEYFGKKDVVQMKKLAQEKRQALAKEELSKLKQEHWHHCPACGLELEEITYKGIHIDKCFNCGGVFLEEQVLENLCGKENKILESLLSLFNFDKETYEE